jgi:hypothetical protein
LEVRGACSSNAVEVRQHTSRKIRKFIVQLEANLQYRLLLDGPFEPHGPSQRFRCGRRGFTSQWRGPRHGDGDSCDGRWSCFLFFRLGLGGGGGRTTGGHCNHDTISTYNNTIRQQQVPERFDFLRLPLPHHPTTLRHHWQSAGQLHDWLEGAVRSRLSFSFLLRLRAHILYGPAAALSCSYASPFGLYSGAGEEVVRPGDIGSWRVAAVLFSVSLQKVLHQRWCNRGRFQQK